MKMWRSVQSIHSIEIHWIFLSLLLMNNKSMIFEAFHHIHFVNSKAKLRNKTPKQDSFMSEIYSVIFRLCLHAQKYCFDRFSIFQSASEGTLNRCQSLQEWSYVVYFRKRMIYSLFYHSIMITAKYSWDFVNKWVWDTIGNSAMRKRSAFD